MHLSRKKLLVAAAAVAALSIGGVGYAYFTSTGSGTGTASVGTSTAFTIVGTTTGSLYPGTNVPVSFAVTNPSTGSQFIASIHLASVTTDVAHAACITGALGDFSMTDVAVNAQIAGGATLNLTGATGGTLNMANTAVSQDACKNAPLTLNFTSN